VILSRTLQGRGQVKVPLATDLAPWRACTASSADSDDRVASPCSCHICPSGVRGARPCRDTILGVVNRTLAAAQGQRCGGAAVPGADGGSAPAMPSCAARTFTRPGRGAVTSAATEPQTQVEVPGLTSMGTSVTTKLKLCARPTPSTRPASRSPYGTTPHAAYFEHSGRIRLVVQTSPCGAVQSSARLDSCCRDAAIIDFSTNKF